MVYSWGRFLDLDDQAVIVAINIFDKMYTEYRYVITLQEKSAHSKNEAQTDRHKCKSDIYSYFAERINKLQI